MHISFNLKRLFELYIFLQFYTSSLWNCLSSAFLVYTSIILSPVSFTTTLSVVTKMFLPGGVKY